MSANGRTLSPEIVTARARELDAAERERRQVRQFTLEHPGMTIGDAYAIQRAWVSLKVAAGRKLRGRKIGLTSRAMQQSSQIDEPDYGDLLDDMFFADGAHIPARRFIVPRLEIELAFTLKRPLAGPGCTLEQVLDATESVVPAMEIIDARIESLDSATRRPRRVEDTISDNAANAGIVLGNRPLARETDLRWVAALCYRNDVIEESGVAAAVLNHPANGIAWLANKLAAHEVQLEAGLVVLAGSFIRPIPVQPGDVFRADYGPHGSVSCTFV
ncbi:MAG: 2-oxo-hept-4-ene-1,7-dioate hydratase [Steroidobacteraceae bacterium]